MSHEANYCKNCKEYIIGDFCFKCKTSIYDQKEELPDFLKDIFGDKNNEKK